MKTRKSCGLDYGNRAVREEILVRQRRDMWTPEQIAPLAKHFRLKPGMARRREDRFRQSVAGGNAAFVHDGGFWCTWGFKP